MQQTKGSGFRFAKKLIVVLWVASPLILTLVVGSPGTARAVGQETAHSDDEHNKTTDDARLAGIRVADVARVELDGVHFSGEYSGGAENHEGLEPFTTDDPVVIGAFLNAFRHETTYHARYVGPPNYVYLVLRPKKGKNREPLTFLVQPRDPRFNGPAFQSALRTLGQQLARDVAATSRRLRHDGAVKGMDIQTEAFATLAEHISKPESIDALLAGLERIDGRAFAFSQNSQLFVVKCFLRDRTRAKWNNQEKVILRFRVALYDYNARLYPGLSLTMPNPPVPHPLWDRIFPVDLQHD